MAPLSLLQTVSLKPQVRLHTVKPTLKKTHKHDAKFQLSSQRKDRIFVHQQFKKKIFQPERTLKTDLQS